MRQAKAEPPLVVHPTVTPRKAPVSAAVTVPADATRAPSFEATLRVIDAVHDDGGLKAIPLTETRATVNIGGFAWRGKTGEPIGIEVSRAGRHPELTLLHEVGHFIDHQALDKKGEFASEKSPLLEIWRKIVTATPTVKMLKLAAAGRKIEGQWAPGSTVEYQEILPLRELWARAYAQYVVTHGTNPALQAQFEVAAGRLMTLYFWPDDEFEAIDLAITTVTDRQIMATETVNTEPLVIGRLRISADQVDEYRRITDEMHEFVVAGKKIPKELRLRAYLLEGMPEADAEWFAEHGELGECNDCRAVD